MVVSVVEIKVHFLYISLTYFEIHFTYEERDFIL